MRFSDGAVQIGVERLSFGNLRRKARMGRLLTHSPGTYKIPTASDRSRYLSIRLWDGENVQPTINQSNVVGEPPFMLAISVFSALHEAIAVTAPDKRALPRLDTPTTPAHIARNHGSSRRVHG